MTYLSVAYMGCCLSLHPQIDRLCTTKWNWIRQIGFKSGSAVVNVTQILWVLFFSSEKWVKTLSEECTLRLSNVPQRFADLLCLVKTENTIIRSKRLLKKKGLFIPSSEARVVAGRMQVWDLVPNLVSVISQLLANNFSESQFKKKKKKWIEPNWGKFWDSLSSVLSYTLSFPV